MGPVPASGPAAGREPGTVAGRVAEGPAARAVEPASRPVSTVPAASRPNPLNSSRRVGVFMVL
ncbi:MAG: hypothetical protein AMXMBFR83_21030 [Phycisphaerae bacterium]